MGQHVVEELKIKGNPVKVEVATRDSEGSVISKTRVPRRSPGGADIATDPFWGKSLSSGDGTKSAHDGDPEDKYLGYGTLDQNGKIYLDQLPDLMLGQVRFGGTIDATGLVTPSTLFINAYGVGTVLTISSNSSNDYTGFFFIADGIASGSEAMIAAGSDPIAYPAISYSNGDWIISNGLKGWAKIANTDAVRSVKGSANPSSSGIGDVVISFSDVGAISATYLNNKSTQAPNNASDDSTFPTAKAVYLYVDAINTLLSSKITTNTEGISALGHSVADEANARQTADRAMADDIQSNTEKFDEYLPISGGEMTGLITSRKTSASNVQYSTVLDSFITSTSVSSEATKKASYKPFCVEFGIKNSGDSDFTNYVLTFPEQSGILATREWSSSQFQANLSMTSSEITVEW